MAQLVKNLPAIQETWVRSLGWEDPWKRERLPTPVVWPREFQGLYSPWGCTERLSLNGPLMCEKGPLWCAMDTGKKEREAMPQPLSRGTLSATTSQVKVKSLSHV